MKRILVIGSPGAGKSTFSRSLSNLLGIPLYHLDMIWHKPDKTTLAREEFDSVLEELLSADSWIIDGNYTRTLKRRIEECDTVFLFDLPTEVCLEGARSRVGVQRSDMPWVEEELDPDFESWICSFREEQLPVTYSILNEVRDRVRVITFYSRAEAESYLSAQAKRM